MQTDTELIVLCLSLEGLRVVAQDVGIVYLFILEDRCKV